MSDDRLRRLDALFAEKVLGREVQAALSATVDYLAGPEFDALPAYTRSLDAAWEGVEIVCRRVEARLTIEHHPDREDDPDYAPDWPGCYFSLSRQDDTVAGSERGDLYAGFACYTSDPKYDMAHGEAKASHPAEALVLACLRAVGCTDEELA